MGRAFLDALSFYVSNGHNAYVKFEILLSYQTSALIDDSRRKNTKKYLKPGKFCKCLLNYVSIFVMNQDIVFFSFANVR